MQERRRHDDLSRPSQQELDRNHESLFALLKEIRDCQVDTSVAIGKVEVHVENLAGPQGRVTKLENTNTRQWWLTAGLGPILLIAHGLARKFGVDV